MGRHQVCKDKPFILIDCLVFSKIHKYWSMQLLRDGWHQAALQLSDEDDASDQPGFGALENSDNDDLSRFVLAARSAAPSDEQTDDALPKSTTRPARTTMRWQAFDAHAAAQQALEQLSRSNTYVVLIF